ncbi:MAG: chemotaxis response regulator protein-glutamate methylesterase [Candidatus Omnitrophica bacterium]|nr:chemotaxis response regulator protein-glutamate methylesterase [Candidatus Omnitrophota bacterium]MCB0410130.1 chemotaxis response regulator protein-glutamate methylesterase [Flavobacteriales bacterium]MCB9748130.1 chemotaxis response regulator protein-glutamate methylesterase [Candidatus Omnitrophota bacterium]
MIKVILADDSVFLRKVVKEALEQTQKFSVIAQANNGKEAIEAVKAHQADILILDCEMPVMTGLEALRRIMQEKPLPVFMFSTLTSEGASVTVRALEYGAVDFLPKPTMGSQEFDETIDALIKKIQSIVFRHRIKLGFRPTATVKEQQTLSSVEINNRIKPKHTDIIAIGSSTGGVLALQNVITKLPKKGMKPIVCVQHMPPNFTKSLADRLNSICELEVCEAVNGDYLEDGKCYIAPGGYQMRVTKYDGRYKLKIQGDEKVSGHCPSCDVLFESVSELFTSNALGVILTGMGADGTEGLFKMHNKGSFVIGQNEASCVVYGMPRAAFEKGAVDIQLDIMQVSQGIKQVLNLN